jgi:hypothetical protein
MIDKNMQTPVFKSIPCFVNIHVSIVKTNKPKAFGISLPAHSCPFISFMILDTPSTKQRDITDPILIAKNILCFIAHGHIN